MVTITVLVDNTVAAPAPRGLRGEWGFAAAVDDVLFDTGQSESVAHNARLLDFGADFETIVLSHAHFDHTAGLDAFLDPADKPTLYCHPEVWRSRYVDELPGGMALPEPVHIGVPFTRTEVESGAEVVEHTGPVEVAPGVHALGEIPREHVENLNDVEPGREELLGELLMAARRVAEQEGLDEGYRVVANNERQAGQSVFHLHFHVLGGRAMGWPPG